MNKSILMAAVCILALTPAGAQSRKIAKQAKDDASVQVKVFKEEGYKALDNEKIDESVKSFLSAKYSDKSTFEVIGKGSDKDINEAKAMAREDALSGCDPSDVVETYFVYRKNRRQFEVVCYSLVKGASAAAARNNATQIARQYENSEAQIAAARAKAAKEKADKERKKAQKKADKAKKKAKKAAKEAEKQAKQALKAKEELQNTRREY